jgi:integrase
MAAIKLRGKKKSWYAIFRDLNRKQHWVKLDSSSRKDAQKAADILEDAANRKKSAQHIRAAFNDLYRTFYGEGLPIATTRDFMAQWLAQKEPETAPSSFLAYKKTVEAFLEFLGPRADADIADITRKDIIDFRNTLAPQRAAVTTNRYVKILRMAFKSAHRDKYLIENPAEHVDIVKDESGEGRKPFTVAEIRAVLDVADTEWRSMIKFGLYSGQRLADIAGLTWENIDLQRGVIRLTTRKTDKRLMIPFAPALRAHIEQLPTSDDPMAPLHPKAFAIAQNPRRPSTLSNQFADLLAQAGLREKVSHRSKGIGRGAKRTRNALSFHALRHTAVSLMKDAGIPEAVVMELIGHESKAMSAHYTHVGMEALQKAAAALPEI